MNSAVYEFIKKDSIARMKSQQKTLITLKNITLRLKDRFVLPQLCWEILQHENWAVLGPNGSGKSALVGALAGHVPVVGGRIARHFPRRPEEAIGCVSFGFHERLMEREENRDMSRFFSGKLENLETVRQTLLSVNGRNAISVPDVENVLKRLGIRHLIDRPIRFLSTGEIRKVIIARAFIKSPQLLILDEPFDGLDIQSKNRLKDSLVEMTRDGMQIVLVTHRFEEITPNITHVLCLKDGKIVAKGRRSDVLTQRQLDRLYDPSATRPRIFKNSPLLEKTKGRQPSAVLVQMRNVTVKYGNKHVLKGLDWIMRRGENWAVVGPNGVGKTTFLRLIFGDDLQAYANEIYLFGQRRGTGESIWEIKKKIGLISSEFQINYRKPIRVQDVVLSGFFDSIGLYRHATSEQISTTNMWMEKLGIRQLGERRFDRCSDGEKRMVLLARCMVKAPLLLILDEPCQGLDPENRRHILELIDDIGKGTSTNIIYVTHNADEILPCMTHILHLENAPPSYTSSVITT
jgi:molybdate transport system ATP-binding protein